MTKATHPMQDGAYTVSTPVYEGPLDLLLYLIERAELDITKLSIAKVTDQYLIHIRNIQNQTAEDVSEFLVLAARLLQIKSEALLPRPPEREPEEEDPGDALARQLIAYKKFKEIAKFIGNRQDAGLKTYLRLVPPPKIEAQFVMTDITIADLFQVALDVFQKKTAERPLADVVSIPKVTIREKIQAITNTIKQFGKTSFYNILNLQKNRNYQHLHVVVAFLAMLELVKRRRVSAVQNSLFADIELTPSDAWTDNTEVMELEFGE